MPWGKAAAGLRLLAGLETGVLGGLLSAGWFAALALMQHERLWYPGNLLASTMFAGEALRAGFGRFTLSGFALYILVCGLAGAVFGVLLPGSASQRRALFAGLLFGLALFFAWRRANPLLVEFTHPWNLLAAQVLFGAALARFPHLYRQLEGAAAPAARPSGDPPLVS